jgi:hypothetical protein
LFRQIVDFSAETRQDHRRGILVGGQRLALHGKIPVTGPSGFPNTGAPRRGAISPVRDQEARRAHIRQSHGLLTKRLPAASVTSIDAYAHPLPAT